MIRITLLAACGTLALAGCTDPHTGRVDPIRTGALGALIGGGAGLVGGAIAQDSQRPKYHYRSQGYGYGYGYPWGRQYQQPYGYRRGW